MSQVSARATPSSQSSPAQGSAPRPQCAPGYHNWKETVTQGQVVCLRCGTYGYCLVCFPALPKKVAVVRRCAKHR
jgi:hypothetical protein